MSEIQAFLTCLKAQNRANNVPSVSEETGKLLCEEIRRAKATRILELGTAHGYSTIWMAAALSETGHIVTVDFSKPSYEAAIANVKAAGVETKVIHVFADALQYVPTLKDPFDFIFLDAEKRSTARLFELVWPLLATGGTMVVDDVVKFREKMADFYALLESRGVPYEIVMTDPDDGVMVLRK
jgi:predicted O-methyltransferase YrrM